MKKSTAFIIFLSLAVLFSLNFISAQSASYYGNFVADTMNRVIGIVQDFFGPVFSALIGVDGFDEFFFSRILLLIVLFSVIFIALKQVPIFQDEKNKWALFVVATVVSLFSVRFMAESELLQMALLPYGALGVSLTIFLPFLIFFYFLHNAIPGNSTLGRRMAWGLFAAVFFGLWITRANQFGDYNWIYWLGIGVVAIAFLFDRQFHTYFGLNELAISRKQFYATRFTELDKELRNIESSISTAPKSVQKVLEKRRKTIEKEMKRIQSKF